MNLVLEKYSEKYFEALNYKLSEEQSQFTKTLEYCINQRKDLLDNNKQIVAIIYETKIVGFFVLDLGDEKFNLTENKNSILIRSLSINPKFQGKGIGKKTMQILDCYVKKNFPHIDEIVLSVNLRNKTAYNLYIKSGFESSGKLIDGPVGKQNILLKRV